MSNLIRKYFAIPIHERINSKKEFAGILKDWSKYLQIEKPFFLSYLTLECIVKISNKKGATK